MAALRESSRRISAWGASAFAISMAWRAESYMALNCAETVMQSTASARRAARAIASRNMPGDGAAVVRRSPDFARSS